jgi:hypothetical protein
MGHSEGEGLTLLASSWKVVAYSPVLSSGAEVSGILRER